MDKLKNLISVLVQKLGSYVLKAKRLLEKILFKLFSSGREIKHQKPKKELVEVHPRRLSQQLANRIFMGFVIAIVALATLTIISNSFKALLKEEKVLTKVETSKSNEEVSNEVNLFMTDFLTAYFAKSDDLLTYFGPGIDVKGTESNQVESRLVGLTLVKVTKQLASYQVDYEVKSGEDWQQKFVVINVPYKSVKGKFYVSDLPYFTNAKAYVASEVKGKWQLKTQMTEKDYSQAKEYVEAFFTAYSSGDNTQLAPFSSDIKALSGYELSALDYYYFIEEKKELVVIAQVRFVDDLGAGHSENFTLRLTRNQQSDTYHVKELLHGIEKTYQGEVK